MALTGAVKSVDISRRRKTLSIAFTPAGNYASPEPVDLTALTNPKFVPGGSPGSLPDKVAATNQPLGYTAELTLGATLAACSVKVYQGGVELTAAQAYPGGLGANEPFKFDISGPLGQF
jgi:hypothetical protein